MPKSLNETAACQIATVLKHPGIPVSRVEHEPETFPLGCIEDGYPNLVVIKLNEEAIGGRKGYLQRIIREDGQGVRGGSIQERVSRDVRDYVNHDRPG